MKLIETKLKEVKIICPEVMKDDRGYFFESYNESNFVLTKNTVPFVQDNESFSSFGTLRGIHFQTGEYQQSKLVRVIKGEIQDIAVDLRSNSPTYRQYFSIILNDRNKKQLFIPKGFGHAFLTLSDIAIVSYKVDNYYNQEHDSGIRFNDSILNIKWELSDKDIIVSDKDKNLSCL